MTWPNGGQPYGTIIRLWQNACERVRHCRATGSKPSPITASWSAACSAPTPLGSGASPPRPSATPPMPPRPGVCGHRALRPGRHGTHRDRAGHRHRRPALALPGDDPRHRHQPGIRLHHPRQTSRPPARHPPRPRTRPLRPHPAPTARIPAPARSELAGLDPAQLTRTRDVASVVDARIRQRVHPLLPQPQGRWSDHVPHLPDAERQTYLTEVAAMMDDRKQRIGAFAVNNALPWAIIALGPVPSDPAARCEWEKKASSISAYREMYGYDHPTDPNPPTTHPTSALPGTRRSAPSAPPTSPTSAPCPTAGCG